MKTKQVLIELEAVREAIRVVQRHLFRDTPMCDDTVRRIILEEVSLLLNMILGVSEEATTGVVEDYPAECDYYDECELIFHEIKACREWRLLETLPIQFFEVGDHRGLVIVHLE